jgi:hypothetical protein
MRRETVSQQAVSGIKKMSDVRAALGNMGSTGCLRIEHVFKNSTSKKNRRVGNPSSVFQLARLKSAAVFNSVRCALF